MVESPSTWGRMRQQGTITRRGFLKTSGAFLVGAGGLSSVLAACSSDEGPSAGPEVSGSIPAGPADIEGQVVRFVNYTNWIGEGEYEKFKSETGAEIREVPVNTGRSSRVVADPSSVDMVLDPLGSLGRVDSAGLLATLNLANIPNFELVDDSFKQGLAGEAETKAVPIDYGRTGILYRTDVVQEEPTSWSDFWAMAPDYSGKVIIPESQDHDLRNALLSLGYDGNTTDAGQVNEAADLLITIKPFLAQFSTTDVVKRLLEGSTVLAMAEDWQGSSAIRDNPDVPLRWVDPTDGVAGYLDCIGAVNTTQVMPAIEQFLNFHLEPENAANFSNTLSVAPIVPASVPFLKQVIREDPIINPPAEVLARITYWGYLGEAQRSWDDAWARVKSA